MPHRILADWLGEREMLSVVGSVVLGVKLAAAIAYRGIRRGTEQPVAQTLPG